MKSGLVLTLWALRALLETGHSLPGPVWVFCNSDEETGSAASKDRILQLSREARAVLVAEPAEAVTGSLKTTRKGNGHYHVHIKGKAAHAGNDPLGGISAVEEMAHQILHLLALADLPNGTSVNVGVARGGTRANIIADEADMDVDVRFLTEKEAVVSSRLFSPLLPYTRALPSRSPAGVPCRPWKVPVRKPLSARCGPASRPGAGLPIANL